MCLEALLTAYMLRHSYSSSSTIHRITFSISEYQRSHWMTQWSNSTAIRKNVIIWIGGDSFVNFVCSSLIGLFTSMCLLYVAGYWTWHIESYDIRHTHTQNFQIESSEWERSGVNGAGTRKGFLFVLLTSTSVIVSSFFPLPFLSLWLLGLAHTHRLLCWLQPLFLCFVYDRNSQRK